jgi:predicted nucleic acid-binding protein
VNERRRVVLDSAALLDLLVARDFGFLVESRVAGAELHVCAHMESELLSVMRRLERDGVLGASACEMYLGSLVAAPLQRHPVCDVIERAWRRRNARWLADPLSFELALSLGATLVTTDPRMADAAGETVDYVRLPSGED